MLILSKSRCLKLNCGKREQNIIVGFLLVSWGDNLVITHRIYGIQLIWSQNQGIEGTLTSINGNDHRLDKVSHPSHEPTAAADPTAAAA